MTTTVTSDRVVKSVAEKMARIIGDKDLDALRELYTPDARVWHSSDNQDKTVAESLEILAKQLPLFEKITYEDVRLTPTPSGYVDQHNAHIVLTTGEVLSIPVCYVVALEGERVKRLDDYMGSLGPLGPAVAALMSEDE